MKACQSLLECPSLVLLVEFLGDCVLAKMSTYRVGDEPSEKPRASLCVKVSGPFPPPSQKGQAHAYLLVPFHSPRMELASL